MIETIPCWTFRVAADVLAYRDWLDERDLLYHWDDDPRTISWARLTPEDVLMLHRNHLALWSYRNPWEVDLGEGED